VTARLAALLAALAAAACAHARPEGAGDGALYRDLQRIVNVREARGWRIDRVEIDAVLPDALQSVCRTDEATRGRVLAWVDARLAELGGPVDEAWRREGRRIERVRDLLEATRVRRLLAAAIEAAPRDCPFWIEPEAHFRGRQIIDDRFLFVLEGGGKFIGLRSQGRNDFAGGGAGRLLFGRTFGPRWGLLAGVEAGGSAEFPRDEAGMRQGIVLAVDFLAPVVVRYRLVNSYVELEGGYLLHVTEQDARAVPGWHVGVAVGVKSVRERFLLPGVAFGASYERTFERPDRAPLHLLKLGLRVTLDLPL
jgi:hypothetical protein